MFIYWELHEIVAFSILVTQEQAAYLQETPGLDYLIW